MVSIYSIIWSALICSFMILCILFIRKRTGFLQKYGTNVLIVLSICCIIRMILPCEFPEFQYIISNDSFYSSVMKGFFSYQFPENALPAVLAVWATGSVIFVVHFIVKYIMTEYKLKKGEISEEDISPDLFALINSDLNMPVRVSSGTPVPLLVGIVHPKVYLPLYTGEYEEKDLYYVLLHEYTHWKKGDLIKKFLINILCSIFWWNPFVYLLRFELTRLLEINCDQTLTKNMDDREVLSYLQSLYHVMQLIHNSRTVNSLHTIGFFNSNEKTAIEQRFALLIGRDKRKTGNRFVKRGLMLFVVVAMVASYYFLPQSQFHVPESQAWDYKTNAVSTAENSYVEITKEGKYYFHYAEYSDEISKQDIDDGYYSIYPVIDHREKPTLLERIKNWFIPE